MKTIDINAANASSVNLKAFLNRFLSGEIFIWRKEKSSKEGKGNIELDDISGNSGSAFFQQS